MIESFIKYYFMLICTFYCHSHILNKKVPKQKIILNLLTFMLSALFICTIRTYVPHITLITLTMLSYIHASTTYNTTFKLNIMASLFSVTMCHFIFFLSNLFISVIATLTIANQNIPENLYLITMPFVGLMQIFLAKIFFRLKPLKYGMPFLLQQIPNAIGIFICVFVVALTSFFTVLDKTNSFYGLIIIASTVLSFILFIWWKAQMTLSYANKATNLEITRLDATIKKLENDVETLSSLIHKDNKLIPAMEMAVCDLLNDPYIISNDSLNKHASSLLADLKKLAAERSGILEHAATREHSLPCIGLIRLDAALRYMYEKSFSTGISLDIHVPVKPEELLDKYISEDALVTLVCDLVENAFISTDNCETKKVCLEFNIENNIYCINFYDTGIPFEPYTIVNAGKKRASTHLDSGGSGIGLMTTFALLNQCCASFVIDEHPHDTQYTKKVSIVFDFLNQFRIHTSREEILDISNPASDLIIEKASEA